MSIKDLWLEYRIAKQSGCLLGILQDSSGNDSDESCLRPEETNIYMPKINEGQNLGRGVWMTKVDIPKWFYYEVGYCEEWFCR